MIFSQNNILVVLASYNSKLKENKLKSLKFINIYSLHTYKFKSKINMKNLVNNFEKKSFFYLSYIDLKVYLKHLKCLKYKYKPRIKNRRISYKRKYISVVENKIHKLFIKKYRKKRIKFMSKKNKRKKKYKLRFLLKKFKIKTKFKFIKSSKKRFVKKRFVKKKFVKKKIYKKFYKRKVKLTKLSIRNRLNLKKKVKKNLFF